MSRNVSIYINSVAVHSRVDQPTLRIHERLYHRPDTATFELLDHPLPTEGQSVVIEIASMGRKFKGTILSKRQVQAKRQQRPRVVVDCIDDTRLLNRRLVNRTFESWRVDSIAHALVNSYSSGFTRTNIDAINSVIGRIEFTAVPPAKALTRLGERIGAHWYVDATDDVHFFGGDEGGGSDPPDLTDSELSFWGFTYERDLSQVRTRVYVEGNGSRVVAAIAIGGTSIPIEAATYFQTAGGQAKVLTNVVSYSGLAGTSLTGSPTGYVAQPTATFSPADDPAAGSLDRNSTYGYALTYSTSLGQTAVSERMFCVSGNSGCARIDNLPFCPELGLAGGNRKVYRTEGSTLTGPLKFVGALGNSQTALAPDALGDGSLGAVGPTTNTAGPSNLPIEAGATAVSIEDLATVPASGWAQLGDQIFSYTGTSPSPGVGSGYLTGIPASGAGAITARVRAGSVKTVPHLTSVIGLVTALNPGDPIQIVVQRNNTAAQTALAALEGGDGIHEHWIQDRRLNATSCQERGDAELLLFKDPEHRGSYKTRHANVKTGRQVTINLTSPTAISSRTVMITDVEYSDFQEVGTRGPVRTVGYSTHYRDFFDVIGDLEEGEIT